MQATIVKLSIFWLARVDDFVRGSEGCHLSLVIRSWVVQGSKRGRCCSRRHHFILRVITLLKQQPTRLYDSSLEVKTRQSGHNGQYSFCVLHEDMRAVPIHRGTGDAPMHPACIQVSEVIMSPSHACRSGCRVDERRTS